MKREHRHEQHGAGFVEVERNSLADTLAGRIRALIQSGEYDEGDRLPAILEMARRFGVGPPTVREALKKLETLGVVDVRHGSGVYVASRRELLVVTRPQLGRCVDPRVLADLAQVRIPLEVEAVKSVALRASPDELGALRRLLDSIGEDADDHRLAALDTAFHRQLAALSGNTILAQMLDALHDLFTGEDGVIQWEPLRRDRDPRAHTAIVEALERGDGAAAAARMRTHLEAVRDAVDNSGGVERTA